MRDELTFNIEGHVKIVSFENEEHDDEIVHLDKRNAIHREHMSLAIARALAGEDSGHVFTMHFGTGGASIDEVGNITYSSPNVTGAADLYTPSYYEVVDPDRGAPTGNTMGARHVNGTVVSDVEIRCILKKNEPFGQAAFDNVSVDDESNFIFDEIALKTDDNLLLAHIVFNPIEKTANRIYEVVYTLRVSLS